MPAPAAVVDAAPAAPPAVSLVSSARSGDTGGRWESGIRWLPEPQAGHGTADPCASAPGTLGDPVSLDAQGFTPFVIWAAAGCTVMQERAEDWQARALRLLEAATPWQVEREFWMGRQTLAAGWGNRHLADGGADDITGAAAAAPRDALACLEAALTVGYGARGMIHATRKLVTLWQAEGLLRRDGRMLMTVFDTVVVGGAGYNGYGAPLARPAAPATSTANLGGSLAPGTYCYAVTARSATGETLASEQVCQVVPAGTATNTVTVDWDPVADAVDYRVYGRVDGALGLLATVGGGASVFTDDGSAAPGAAPPAEDTSGAPAAGEEWAYATDMLSVRTGEAIAVPGGEDGISAAVRFDVNKLVHRAERFAAVQWDGIRHVGIRAAVPACG